MSRVVLALCMFLGLVVAVWWASAAFGSGAKGLGAGILVVTIGLLCCINLVDRHFERQRRAIEEIRLELEQARWERRDAALRAAAAENRPAAALSGPIVQRERDSDRRKDMVAAVVVVVLLAVTAFFAWRFWVEVGDIAPQQVERLRSLAP